MQQAVALDAQESAALLVHYGDILKALGENFMAEIYWRKALEKGFPFQKSGCVQFVQGGFDGGLPLIQHFGNLRYGIDNECPALIVLPAVPL